jgi:hypothetical protein
MGRHRRRRGSVDESILLARQQELITLEQEEVVQRLRPSRILSGSLRIEQDGAAFYCLFVGGHPLADIASGIVGFGDTPEEATTAFDSAWKSVAVSQMQRRDVEQLRGEIKELVQEMRYQATSGGGAHPVTITEWADRLSGLTRLDP